MTIQKARTPQKVTHPQDTLHPVATQYKSKLQAILSGEYVPDVPKRVPMQGKISQLWNPYISGQTSLARKGITGADLAYVLCARGYLKIFFGGRVYEAGTDPDELPAAELMREVNPPFEFVKKPPTRDELYSWMPRSSDRMPSDA
jgi:hypothetical protein